ncbi:MAG: exo-alpha-sialidase [Spirochaetales bacterium]|jgi:hypothetical protein|nr:exo-alpha-sialidase [Spirochaetales bacterium]
MERLTFVEMGSPTCARLAGHELDCRTGHIYLGPGRDFVYGDRGIGAGDFHITARLSLCKPPVHQEFIRMPGVEECNAAFCFSGGDAWQRGEGEIRVSGFLPSEVRRHSRLYFGHDRRLCVDGPVFGGLTLLDEAKDWIAPEKPFTFEVIRSGNRVQFLFDRRIAHEIDFTERVFGKVGFTAGQGSMHLFDFGVEGNTYELDWQRSQPVGYSMPVIDISGQPERQVVLARGSETVNFQHPSTVLMEDGRTILCPWTYEHGGALGPMKRSEDGGLTWETVETPEGWSSVKNCPTIHRLAGPDGNERLVVQSSNDGEMMQAISEDGGVTWSDMNATGISCTVAPITIEPISDSRHLSLFHEGKRIFMSVTVDGGLSWSEQRMIAEKSDTFLCEPAIIRSPNGKQLAAVIRENGRWYNSQIIFSNDEGDTWSEPEDLPGSLSGDRHLARYAADGRIVMVFRDTGICSKTNADFVGWVGTYEDLVEKRQGQYRLRLIANSKYAHAGWTGYPGLERLTDGTFVATTYAVIEAEHKSSIVSVRFKLSEIDAIAKKHEPRRG